VRFQTLFVILFFCSQSFAWTHKPEAGLGYTSNANYEETDVDSDLYLWLRNFSHHTNAKNDFNLWLSYKDFMTQSQNDALNWRGGMSTPADFMSLDDWSLDLGVGGQHYLYTSPATTEESFGHLFAELAVIRSFEIQSNMEISLEPGYQIKGYSDLGGLTEHRFYFLSTLNYDLTPQHKISPAAEFGIIISSDSLYSRNYLALSTDWFYQIREDLSFGAGLLLKFTTYPNRNVSTSTLVARRRNTFRALVRDEVESRLFSQISANVTKGFGNWSLKALAYAASQSSKSGFENYTELGLRASTTLTF